MIVGRKLDKFKTFAVTADLAIVLIIYFYLDFVNISPNFICFIIENYLYYLDCACNLFKKSG